ncbi:MAG TPA: diacylglycerol kinase family protein [Blastocatellia bacterium]|nr:diacylglycerol kinase family protein [Blastocatellia bacterium]
MRLRRATIIYNPKSGRERRRERSVDQMIRLLELRGITSDAQRTSGPGSAGGLATDAAKRSEVIIGYGGDGTLNEIIQGMARGAAVLAVWPGGTANVAAHELKMPRKLDKLADVIAAGKTQGISLGLATQSGSNEPGRYFLMFAGIGLDASICRGVDPELKGRTGQFAFVVSGLKHLIRWQPDRFRVEIDGKAFDSQFTLVANGRSYGGGIEMARNARLEDPCFEVFIVPHNRGRAGLVWDLLVCQLGHRGKSSATVLKARRVEANQDSGAWVEADGEVLSALPMEFSIVPNALQVIVP